MRSILIKMLSKLGVGVTSTRNLENLNADRLRLQLLNHSLEFQRLLENSMFSTEQIKNALSEFSNSTAQLHQDLISLMVTKFKTHGFFVEFGATDGKRFSNSFMLEKNFNWSGILAEPGRKWHQSLKLNRNAIIDTRCVWNSSGEKLEFNETEVGELSTLEMFSTADLHAEERKLGNRYLVETISLEDLLAQNGAPKFIDYLSIDTEGSEYEILKRFDFDKYTFGFISCEHNYTENRERVVELLSSHGYKRVLEHMSFFDDWFIHDSLIKAEGFI